MKQMATVCFCGLSVSVGVSNDRRMFSSKGVFVQGKLRSLSVIYDHL